MGVCQEIENPLDGKEVPYFVTIRPRPGAPSFLGATNNGERIHIPCSDLSYFVISGRIFKNAAKELRTCWAWKQRPLTGLYGQGDRGIGDFAVQCGKVKIVD